MLHLKERLQELLWTSDKVLQGLGPACSVTSSPGDSATMISTALLQGCVCMRERAENNREKRCSSLNVQMLGSEKQTAKASCLPATVLNIYCCCRFHLLLLEGCRLAPGHVMTDSN